MRALEIGPGMGFFTVELARLVGPTGRVYSVDLQENMLAGVRRRAASAGVGDRIETRVADPGDRWAADLAGSLDFVFAFFMVHEVPDKKRFLSLLHSLLVPGGIFYLAEPFVHTSRSYFSGIAAIMDELGFEEIARPRIWGSRTVVYRKAR